MAGERMKEQVCEVLRDHARLPVDPFTLPETADLYDSGMTSHASVNVMLALEEAFDVELPDSMLTRSVFRSIASICSALDRLDRAAAA